GFYDSAIMVDPADPKICVAGGGFPDNVFPWDSLGYAVVRTTDGGTTWNPIAAASTGGDTVHADVHNFAFASQGRAMDALCDGGSGRPSNRGGAGTNLNGKFRITQFYSIARGTNPDSLMGGPQDKGSLVTPASKTAVSWNQPPPAVGDGTTCAVRTDSTNII